MLASGGTRSERSADLFLTANHSVATEGLSTEELRSERHPGYESRGRGGEGKRELLVNLMYGYTDTVSVYRNAVR